MRAVGGRWALPTDRLGSGCCEVIEVAELGLCARLILAGVFEIRRRPFYVLNQIWPRHGELAWVESIRVAGWLVSPIREPILCDPERDRAPGPYDFVGYDAVMLLRVAIRITCADRWDNGRLDCPSKSGHLSANRAPVNSGVTT